MADSTSTEFFPRDGYLHARLRGRDILDHKAATVQAIAETLKTHGLQVLLLDCREVPGPVSFMDRFQLGIMAGRYLSGVVVGVLARPEQADPQRIGQLVARNRGTEVEVFTDPAKAEAWIQQRARPS